METPRTPDYVKRIVLLKIRRLRRDLLFSVTLATALKSAWRSTVLWMLLLPETALKTLVRLRESEEHFLGLFLRIKPPTLTCHPPVKMSKPVAN